MALDVGVPAVGSPLPGDRQHGRVLFTDRLGLSDQVLALGLIELAIDQRQERFEVFVAPLRVVLWSLLAIPAMEVIRGVQKRGHSGAECEVESARLRLFKPD